MQTPMPEFVKKMTVYDMDKDFDEIVSKVVSYSVQLICLRTRLRL